MACPSRVLELRRIILQQRGELDTRDDQDKTSSPGDNPVDRKQTQDDTDPCGPPAAVGEASYRVHGDRKNRGQEDRAEELFESSHAEGCDQMRPPRPSRMISPRGKAGCMVMPPVSRIHVMRVGDFPLARGVIFVGRVILPTLSNTSCSLVALFRTEPRIDR